MNVLLDYQVILLPKRDYWKWVRACAKYVMTFGTNITDDLESAINYMAPGQVITFPIGEGLFPDHDNIEAWLQQAAPGIRLDPLDVKSSKKMKSALGKRMEMDDRYGQKQKPFYLLWPTDYPVITQAFGANPQIYTRFGMPGHEGIDFRALTNTNVYCCAEGTVYEVHTNPKDHPYGIHVRVRHKSGYRTVYGHLARALVSVGQFVQAGEVLGKADSTGASTAAHLHLTLERDGATARKETKYPKDVIDPTPFLVWPDGSHKKSLPESVWPAGRCLIGALAHADGPLTKADLELVAAAALEAIKIEGNETPENIAALRKIGPGMMIVGRLMCDFSGDAVAPSAFLERVKVGLQALNKAGVSYFEVGEHPNSQLGGWGRSWRNGEDFASWFVEVLAGLKKLAPQARFGFPGLEPGTDVVGRRGDAERFLTDAESAVTASDWIGVTLFGGPPSSGWERDLAKLVADYRSRFPDKLLFLTQIGKPIADLSAQGRAQALLALFRRLRSENNVAAAFCYAITPDSQRSYLGWRTADGLSLGIAEAVGRREF